MPLLPLRVPKARDISLSLDRLTSLVMGRATVPDYLFLFSSPHSAYPYISCLLMFEVL